MNILRRTFLKSVLAAAVIAVTPVYAPTARMIVVPKQPAPYMMYMGSGWVPMYIERKDDGEPIATECTVDEWNQRSHEWTSKQN